MFKKFFNSFLIFLMMGTFGVSADEFNLEKVDPDFMGTYVQVNFIWQLNQTLSFDKALNSSVQKYPILILKEDICYSNSGFHDGFAVRSKDFARWNFIKRGDERIIIDEDGVSHKRISKDYEDGYKALEAYVLKCVFQDAIHLENIRLYDNEVYIDDEKFTVDMDVSFCEGDNVALWLVGSGRRCALCIEGIAAKLYDCKRGKWAMTIEKADTVYKTIPYFYWNDKNYPNVKAWGLSKDEYRFLRNMIYAKHGYIFKSEELNRTFGKFDWYKQNPSYTDSLLSKEEKEIIERIKKRESE